MCVWIFHDVDGTNNSLSQKSRVHIRSFVTKSRSNLIKLNQIRFIFSEKTTEAALGVAAQAELDPSQKSILPGGGGFAAGRMGAFGFDGK